MFKTLSRYIYTAVPSADVNYDSAKARFVEFASLIRSIHIAVDNFAAAQETATQIAQRTLASVDAVFQSANANAPTMIHPHTTLITYLHQSHTRMVSHTIPLIQRCIESTLTSRLLELGRIFDQLQFRCDERDALRIELDNINAKTLADRKLQTSRKETPAEVERRERHAAEFTAVNADYHRVNNAVTQSLQILYENRLDILSVIAQSLIQCERYSAYGLGVALYDMSAMTDAEVIGQGNVRWEQIIAFICKPANSEPITAVIKPSLLTATQLATINQPHQTQPQQPKNTTHSSSTPPQAANVAPAHPSLQPPLSRRRSQSFGATPLPQSLTTSVPTSFTSTSSSSSSSSSAAAAAAAAADVPHSFDPHSLKTSTLPKPYLPLSVSMAVESSLRTHEQSTHPLPTVTVEPKIQATPQPLIPSRSTDIFVLQQPALLDAKLNAFNSMHDKLRQTTPLSQQPVPASGNATKPTLSPPPVLPSVSPPPLPSSPTIMAPRPTVSASVGAPVASQVTRRPDPVAAPIPYTPSISVSSNGTSLNWSSSKPPSSTVSCWTCPNCRYANLISRRECSKCHAQFPSAATIKSVTTDTAHRTWAAPPPPQPNAVEAQLQPKPMIDLLTGANAATTSGAVGMSTTQSHNQ